jgi:hypothetical protein
MLTFYTKKDNGKEKKETYSSHEEQNCQTDEIERFCNIRQNVLTVHHVT